LRDKVAQMCFVSDMAVQYLLSVCGRCCHVTAVVSEQAALPLRCMTASPPPTALHSADRRFLRRKFVDL